MSTYYDSQNNPHTLAERIGSGGEGTVYFCEDRNLVAKIYHEPIDEDKAEKLRWMAANKNERLLKVAAWVVDVLTDEPDGAVVGFIMPSIKAKEIHELYSLKSRRVYFPEATWHFLVHTAANVARAFYNLHRDDHVMGDVNHGNCVVLADGTVKLIDCDSFSIKTENGRYACEVGVATHLAPELQGADLGEIEREFKHDNFGLAVIIFQLLFLGRHPFAGTYLGAEDKAIEDCIRELRFAYGDDAKTRQVKQPPGTLSLRAVSPRVALMFERAFLTEDRPEAKEWIEALEDLSNNLEQCALHPGHFYANHLAACPFCEIENQTGVMLFPFITENQLDGEKPFNIFTVESLIASIGGTWLETLPAKPSPLTAALPAPSANVVEARRASRSNLVISLTTQFIGIVLLMGFFGVGIAAFLGILAMIFWLVFTNVSVKYLRGELSENLEEAQQQWEKLENEWANGATVPNLDQNVHHVRQKVDDYQKFQQENIREARQLQDIGLRRELFQHLRSKTLADAPIEGIGRQEKQWLVGKEIKTAAEISESRIRGFHDFNGELVPKLLEWRARLETEFMSQPHPINLKQENEQFLRETARRRRSLEMEIEHALGILRSGAVNVRRRQQEISKQAAEIAGKLAQTTSDAAHLGTNSALVIGLILITFLTPYIGFIVNQINEPPKPPSVFKDSAPIFKNNSPRDLETPAASITDAEIAQLSAERREIYANNLYTQVVEAMIMSVPDLGDAERKIRLAIRFKPTDASLFAQLGNILYKRGKYEDSVRELNRALKLDSKDTLTKTYLGKSYLELKRYREAEKILAEAVKQDPNQSENQFNLGLARMNLKQYNLALEPLEWAVANGGDNADEHYQLGLCYGKLGLMEKVRSEYEKLLDIDEEKAEQLADELGLSISGTSKRKNKSYGSGSGVGTGSSAPPPPPAPPVIRTVK